MYNSKPGEIIMKELSKRFITGDYTYEQIERDGPIAIYRATSATGAVAFEVFTVPILPDGTREVYPFHSAVAFSDLESARKAALDQKQKAGQKETPKANPEASARGLKRFSLTKKPGYRI